MLTTAPRTRHLVDGDPRRAGACADACGRPRDRPRLRAPDLELLLGAVGDREDIATSADRARLARIRIALELDLAELLAE